MNSRNSAPCTTPRIPPRISSTIGYFANTSVLVYVPWTTRNSATTAAKKMTRYPIITEYSFGYCVQFWLRKPAQPEGVQLEREEERERDRQDADEAADGALRVAQDEHPEQEQDDENVDDVDRSQRFLMSNDDPSCDGGRMPRSAGDPGEG